MTDTAFETFKSKVYQKTGIDLNQYKQKQMKRRLTTLMSKRGYSSYDDYWLALQRDEKLYREFLDRITINVSEFFRNPQRWNVLEETILPKIIKQKGKDEKLKIWSAACSTGEEPYSLAMVLKEFFPPSQFDILATDLDETVLNQARKGVYSEERIKEVNSDRLFKYFNQEDKLYHVKDEIKKCVNFKKHNLLKDPYDKNFDLILCRNVMIYFTEEAKSILYKNFYQALAPGGVLFVGSTEQIFNASKLGFQSIATFFYQK
ncbi:CheR family methyltransferase [Natranaerobius thermophilus]|uniref:protein-glutamate O-methyltransferase n=1 Tax=Natranaerobius thermophilus (strain ATCC BAA-1301 / DSM 18059 / JW/NM-WN-LF) TaxID=457570 RepID=B2A4K3_NATTJ|nr:protein-glutamate O-methyltransferase CheR [Natranaerobius thermophilus]ACB85178.1 MCP methyltransferase, CheR-type [Natranaerobius thermophilus JW/NM-WN-LF]